PDNAKLSDYHALISMSLHLASDNQVYIPKDELKRHSVTPEVLEEARNKCSESWTKSLGELDTDGSVRERKDGSAMPYHASDGYCTTPEKSDLAILRSRILVSSRIEEPAQETNASSTHELVCAQKLYPAHAPVHRYRPRINLSDGNIESIATL